jgi:glycosyltransferase involved in cell wall biosynthesis
MKIIYLPLEHEDSRYTKAMDDDITAYLQASSIPFVKILPEVSLPWTAGSFLNAPKTIAVKSLQIAELAKMYGNGGVDADDVVFTSDLWMPGIEAIAYLNYFTNKRVRLRGFLHAGSFTDTDFVRDMERWAKGFEDVVFDIADKVYVGSHFIKNDVVKKRLVSPEKVVVSGLPMDTRLNYSVAIADKEDIVIFNGRNCDEKQPWLFDQLAESVGRKLPGVRFINTQALGLSKDEYYALLAKAKVVVSFALQENFGYGIAEAVALGCRPVLPNRLVYPELYPASCLYATMSECEQMVVDALGKEPAPRTYLSNDRVFDSIFGDLK